MKSDNNLSFSVFFGLLLLGSCTYNAAKEIKDGLESVSDSLDRIAQQVHSASLNQRR